MLERPREITFADLEFKVDGDPFERRGQSWAPMIAYVKGHSVAEILDEWAGPLNWKDHYETVVLDGKEVVRCYLAVRVEHQDGSVEWVTKEDIGGYTGGFGDVSNNLKGGISDAFKRVATRKWGAGRRVYDLARITAPVDTYTSSGKTRAKITTATLDYIRQAFQDKYPWLEGEPVEEEIGDAGPPSQPQTATETPAQPAKAPSPQPAAETPSEAPSSEGDGRKAIAARLRQIPANQRGALGEYLAERTVKCGREIVPLWPLLGRSQYEELGPAKTAHWAAAVLTEITKWEEAGAA